MKKVIVIVIVSTIAVFSLQGLWMKSMYRAFTNQTIETMESALVTSIGKEIAYRKKEQPFKDPKNPTFVYKRAKDMTPEERSSLKGDTLNYDELSAKNIGNNLYEVFLQIRQDKLIEKENYIQLHTLDSLFQAELQKAKIEARYRLMIYDKDTIVTEQTGTLKESSEESSSTRLFPIGTKGLQFVQVKADIGLSAFLRQMLYILMASVGMVVVILGCVVYLMVVIRRKEQLFKQREANVNGTVHDLKSPLNGIVTLLGFLRNKQTDSASQTLMDGIIRMPDIRKVTDTLPVIIISSHTEADEVKRALQQGAIVYLKKPIDIYELKAYIERYAHEWKQTILHIGEMELNTENRILSHQGEEVKRLTWMEYGILTLLYGNKGKSVPYTDFSELWEDAPMSESSLHNFISRVRKALSIDPTVSIESTGKGYKLNI